MKSLCLLIQMSYDDFMVTHTDELRSPDFKLCMQEAISALSTNVDKSIDMIVRALYGAAACMMKTVGYKKKRLNDWFKPRVCANEKVKRQLRKFREPIIMEKRKICKIQERI